VIWKAEEWQSESGYWHCGCLEKLGQNSNAWYLPARILNLTPADYIKFMIKEYKPDRIYANKEKCLVFFSWSNQADMRLFKNFINKKAREANFNI